MGCSQSNQAATEQEQPKKRAVVAGKAPEASSDISNKLALGAGCYWGTEKYIKRGKSKCRESINQSIYRNSAK